MANGRPARLSKAQTAEQLWLLYYNQYLFHQGLISEQRRNLMKVLIQNRGNALPS